MMFFNVSRFNELDEINEQRFTRDNPIDWLNQKCEICNFKLAVSLSNRYKKDKLTTWYDFSVQKEHLFLQNIYP